MVLQHAVSTSLAKLSQDVGTTLLVHGNTERGREGVKLIQLASIQFSLETVAMTVTRGSPR